MRYAFVLSALAIASFAGCAPIGGGEAPAPQWKSLFDGKTMSGWKPVGYGTEGPIEVIDGALDLGFGQPMSGVTYSRGAQLPTNNYEFEVEAMRVDGVDIFCALSFPVGEGHCSFVVGGWGGTVVGLSNIDDKNASENQTTKVMAFDDKRWYRIRLRVTDRRIRTWIDDKPVVDQKRPGHQVTIHSYVDLAKPLGISTFSTSARLRGIRYRTLDEREHEKE